jgi:ribosomal protein L40E
VRWVFCNNCGYSNAIDAANCSICGFAMREEPHISEVALGNVVFCELCTAANIQDANYCRICGRKLASFVVQVTPKSALAGVEASTSDDGACDASEKRQAAFMHLPQEHESLLKRLDRMEREMEAMQDEAPPESQPNAPDQLDAHEETLKTIASTLDSLIADLLEAEVREYTFPEFMHPNETDFPAKKRATAGSGGKKKDKSMQEVIVMAALVAAIFLVGMTFGLWGSYFFGL